MNLSVVFDGFDGNLTTQKGLKMVCVETLQVGLKNVVWKASEGSSRAIGWVQTWAPQPPEGA